MFKRRASLEKQKLLFDFPFLLEKVTLLVLNIKLLEYIYILCTPLFLIALSQLIGNSLCTPEIMYKRRAS